MAERKFLDESGLALYDELAKTALTEAVVAEKDAREAADKSIIDTLAELGTTNAASYNELKAALDTLNGTGDGSVKKAVDTAVDTIVAGAPEALDTLKELSDWIATDEGATADLVKTVGRKSDMAYVDNKLEELDNSFSAISSDTIKLLFKKKVALVGDIEDALDDLKGNEVLVLTGTEVIDKDLRLDHDVAIDANGATFTGVILAVPEVEVIIKNAVFTNPLMVGGAE